MTAAAATFGPDGLAALGRAWSLLLSRALPEGTPLGLEEEARLVRAARLGSRGARERLYTAHVARVWRAVRGVSRSDADADDATQDAFVDALLHLDRYEGRPGVRFVAWLVTLALNCARKRRAAADRTRPEAPEVLAAVVEAAGEAAAGPGAPEERLLRRRALLAALARLPVRDREVVALYFGAELTAEEVGRAVGASAAAVRKVCERRRRELAAALGEEVTG